MAATTLDAVVVGAGQGGLGVSYFLQAGGHNHVVLERGRIGESWRSQRWDSFALNTPNSMNGLPGAPYDGPRPDGFLLRDEFVEWLERYPNRFDLPVRTGVAVTAVESDGGDGFRVHAKTTRGSEELIRTKAVVIASGGLQTPRVPGKYHQIPHWVVQLHTAGYRNPSQLPPGAIVVVGGGQSGCQITEDLLEGGRRVYLCTSRVGRVPRRYRGRDAFEWMATSGMLRTTVEELEDPSIRHLPQPLVSGLGRVGHTVSLQQLWRQGAVLLGHLIGVDGDSLRLDDTLGDHIRYADEVSLRFKQDIDTYLQRTGIERPPSENDPADVPDPDAWSMVATSRLDLRIAGASAIIWCTGFTADFSWIHLPVLDQEGMPVHDWGVSPVPGLYFIGLPWLHSRKSGLICGIADDAEHVAEAVGERLGSLKLGWV